MIVGVPKETLPGERRVALTPDALGRLQKAGLDILVEAGAGVEAGFPDAAYADAGARMVDRATVFSEAQAVLMVRSPSANPATGADDLASLTKDHLVIGFAEPLDNPAACAELAASGAMLMSMELVPRITRAQSMDALSSMATIGGYKAVLLAATELPKMFPMMMTAAGTIRPARVFVVGAGVAGLQAIASAKKLGAVVQAYDVRPAVREQVESLGGRFVELELDASDAEDAGGYAKELGEDFYRKQREMMLEVVAESDVVITTAAIPGKKAPILITEEMVDAMPAGSVVVDLAAERGGNCALTKVGEVVRTGGVTILGPENLPATVPADASRMYARNISTLLQLVVEEGALKVDLDDEIVAGCLVTKDGEVVHPRVKELLAGA